MVPFNKYPSIYLVFIMLLLPRKSQKEKKKNFCLECVTVVQAKPH